MPRAFGLLATLCMLALMLLACDGDGEGPSTADSTGTTEPETTATTTVLAPNDDAAEPSPGCHVEVTGDVEASWDGFDDGGAVLTDYWISIEEHEAIAGLFGEEIDVRATIEVGGPIQTLLSLICYDGPFRGRVDPPPNQVILDPRRGATRRNLVFGPGSYVIQGGELGDPASAGLFRGSLHIERPAVWVLGDGSLEISRWDLSKIEGRFAFPASATSADGHLLRVEVSGTFSFSCRSSSVCE